MQIPIFADEVTITGDGTRIRPLTSLNGNVIASGTAALDTALIAAGTAGAVQSIVAPDVLSTDNMMADFNDNPSGIVGYQPGAMLTILKWCSAGHINLLQVNNTGVDITPAPVTLNWKVIR